MRVVHSGLIGYLSARLSFSHPKFLFGWLLTASTKRSGYLARCI